MHELNESELEFEFSDFSQEDQEENSLNQDRMAGSPIAYRLRKSYYSFRNDLRTHITSLCFTCSTKLETENRFRAESSHVCTILLD